ncbi:MAG: hypothetical protein ACOYWZ_00740 [Bacillota bacterium]
MSYLSPVFLIGNIRIGNIEGASCLNIGNNLPIGFESYKKQNQGFGSISGDNNDIQDIRSLLSDPGKIDMLNCSEKKEFPDWVKELVKSNISDDKVLE